MTRIHFFQRYSQPENVLTNNALLFLGRLYELAPEQFERVLRDVFDDDEFEVGVRMLQQRPTGRGSTPDGWLIQRGFQVIVETKRDKKSFSADQLARHARGFDGAERKILLLLSPEPLNDVERGALRAALETGQAVSLQAAAFEDLIGYARDANAQRADPQVERLIDDYEFYCSEERVLPTSHYWMRVMATGWSFEINRSHRLYYDAVERGYSAHGYLGFYKDKSVRGLGKVENIVKAELVDGELRNVQSDLGRAPTGEQERLIRDVIPLAVAIGHPIERGHRFFVVERFIETDFRKPTKGGLMRAKYFDLRKYVPSGKDGSLPAVDVIAAELRGKSWDDTLNES